MAGLSSPGIGSGLDVSGLVTKLVTATKTPLQNQIDSRRSQVTTQLSGLSSLKSVLASFQSALGALSDGSAFTQFLASSSGTALTANADATAQPGSYAVDVEQLATAQKASSGAFTSGTTFASGAVTITVGNQTMTVPVGAGNNTLAQLASAINRSTENPDVTASVVHASDGDHLVLTSTQTGEANAFTVSGSGDAAGLSYDPSNGVNGLTTVTAAQDAKLSVDGFDVTSASNTVEGVIKGVTLNLTQVSGATPDTLTIAADSTSIQASVKAFVTSYNNFVAATKSLTSYDPASKKAGALLGDSTVLAITGKLSRALGSVAGAPGSAIQSLADLGIHFELGGSLSLDTDKLGTALAAHPEQVQGLFSTASGLGQAVTPMLSGYLQAGGILDNRTDSLNQNTDNLDDQQSALDARMDKLTTMYTAQFTKLDQLLTSLNSTSTFLTQQLAAFTAKST